MDNGFRKFKRKIRLSALLRSVLMGLSLGVIVVAALWLVDKLTKADPNLMRYGIIGGVVALLGSAIFALILMPTDKRLAKRLDNKLQLNEKVQTMIAFRKDDSEMAKLQRETTQELLMQTPTKKARNKSAWLTLILPVLAAGAMTAAFLVPANAIDPPPAPETGWKLTNFSEQALRDLITYVDSSNMQDTPKQEIVAELEDLLATLKTVRKETEMHEEVVSSISNIYDSAKVCHIHTDIVAALKNSLSEDVKQFGNSLGTLDSNTINADMDELAAKVLADGNINTELAATVANGIDVALKLTRLDESNPIYKAVADFGAELGTITASTSQTDIVDIFTRHKTAIGKSIQQTYWDVTVEKYTINRLMTIFGILRTELDPEILDTFTEEEITGSVTKPGDDDKETGTGGGIGDGEMLSGNNDEIYDPGLDKLVPFPEVISEYQATLLALLNEGNVDPELAEMIESYLATLRRWDENGG